MRQLRDGVFSLQSCPFDPMEVIDTVSSIFAPQAQAKKIKLRYHNSRDLTVPTKSSSTAIASRLIDETTKDDHNVQTNQLIDTSIDKDMETLPRLVGDERRFRQVLINLVKNALKFTSKGSIDISASYSTRKELLIVHVKDTGAGIAP